MSRFRRITINNHSGTTQSYAIFAAEPTISPPVEPVQNDIIASFRGVSGHGGQAIFKMPQDSLQALCGSRAREMTVDSVQIEILDRKPITLGRSDSAGRVTAGSTCDVSIRMGSPQFDADQALPGLGDRGAFCLRTKPDFTYQEAKAGRFILGYGLNVPDDAATDIGPSCIFCPEPNTLYQIKPANTFYIAVGSFEPRSPTPDGLEQQSTCCKIDFDALQTDDVTLVHSTSGILTVQQSTDRSKL